MGCEEQKQISANIAFIRVTVVYPIGPVTGTTDEACLPRPHDVAYGPGSYNRSPAVCSRHTGPLDRIAPFLQAESVVAFDGREGIWPCIRSLHISHAILHDGLPLGASLFLFVFLVSLADLAGGCGSMFVNSKGWL